MASSNDESSEPFYGSPAALPPTLTPATATWKRAPTGNLCIPEKVRLVKRVKVLIGEGTDLGGGACCNHNGNNI